MLFDRGVLGDFVNKKNRVFMRNTHMTGMKNTLFNHNLYIFINYLIFYM